MAEAALRAGVTIVELGTPLLKYEGVRNVVPIFRQRFPEALLLADMKTMDGGEGEANAVYGGGANVIDFLALAGEATAKAICAVRDTFREADPAIPRLAFADVLIPMQGPTGSAIETAKRMLDAGVDGVGIHLQYDARRADPGLAQGGYLHDVASAVFESVGDERVGAGGGRPQRAGGGRLGPQRLARLRHQRQSRLARRQPALRPTRRPNRAAYPRFHCASFRRGLNGLLFGCRLTTSRNLLSTASRKRTRRDSVAWSMSLSAR